MGIRSPGYGFEGPRGLTGPQGATGPAGPKGDTGGAGPVGPSGAKGDTGSTGPKGDTGIAGAKGDAGQQGQAGPQGGQGQPGPQGATGPQGTQGPQGPQGSVGPSFTVAAPTVTALTAAQKNGTAFQPRADGPSMVNVTGTMAGVTNVMTAVTVAVSPTQNGAYTTVGTFSLFIAVAGPAITDSGTGSFLVPSGHWVRVTQTGVSVLANIVMNRIVWNL